jgi:hypothetical protein
MTQFTVDQFLEVFEPYNVTVWPAQLFLYPLGILAIGLAFQRKADFSRSVSLILTFLWIWMGLVYHLWFFRVINQAALAFADILCPARHLLFDRWSLQAATSVSLPPGPLWNYWQCIFRLCASHLSRAWILARPSISCSANFWPSLSNHYFYLGHVALD